MFMYRMTQPEEIQPEEIRPVVIPAAEETVEISMPAAMQVMQSKLLNRVHPVK